MKRAYVIIAICIIVLCSIELVNLASAEGFSHISPLKTEEAYRMVTNELIPREEISLFLVTEERIFLYFDYTGIINVYSHDGIFLYGLQINSLKNGIGDIAFKDGILYIKARGNMLYIFDGTVLLDNFRRQDNPQMYSEVEVLMGGEPCHQMNNITYVSSGNKILKKAEQHVVETVISLPQKNTNIRDLAIFTMLLIAALMHYIRKPAIR